MRKSRKLILNATGLFHKMWRGHNREHIFADNGDKADYLAQLKESYKGSIKQNISLFAFSIMGNHTHEVGQAKRDPATQTFDVAIDQLSRWMRNAHSRFGARFNRRHNRQGKVAYDRPKTSEIENEHHVLRVMFYADANPVRAGIVSHPSKYPHSSYNYYAHGKKSDFTDCLTPPEAYLALGKTQAVRRKKYRKMCDHYLRWYGLIDDAPTAEMEGRFIGSQIWRDIRRASSKHPAPD